MRVVQTETSALMVTPWSNGKNRFEGHGMDIFSGLTFHAMKKAAQTDARIKARVDQFTIGYPMAFYDLVADPDQRINAISDPAHAAEIKRLQDILMDYMVKTEDPQLDNYKTLLAGGTVDVDIRPKGKRSNLAE
jgi:N-sulfoglucosamine sulfohydrolase